MLTLEKDLSLRFTDPALLKTALTHPSVHQGRKGPNYERLELLGDTVLNLVITEQLLALYLNEPEGDIVKRRAALVNGQVLAEVAQELNLGQHLILSDSEEAGGGRQNKRNLENVMEALIGAVYQDAGMEAARGLVLRCFETRFSTQPHPPQDAKTALQEWAQGSGLPLPAYEVMETSGPAHAPQFIVQVSVEGFAPVQASGGNKRLAERLAAETLFEQIRKKS